MGVVIILIFVPPSIFNPTVPGSMSHEIVATTQGIVTIPFCGVDNRQLYDDDVSRTWLPLKLTVDSFESAGELVGVQGRNVRIFREKKRPPSVALQRRHAQSSLAPSRNRPLATCAVLQAYGVALLVGVDVQALIVECARRKFTAQKETVCLLRSNVSLPHGL